MYPDSAYSVERSSSRGARNPANARYTGMRYERKPLSPGMALRTRTTAGPKPSPMVLTKHSSSTCPTSNRRTWAVARRRTARTGAWPYIPTSFAKSFPVPTGTTPSDAAALSRRSPFATSCTVPSPPTATTQVAPSRAACAASAVP